MLRNYTVQDLRDYREQNSCGLAEARAALERRDLLVSVHIAYENRDFDLLCDVVRELVTKVRFA